MTNVYTTVINSKDGIENTATLASEISDHDHFAAYYATKYNSAVTPTGTSGWFLPSVGQWNLILQGMATKKAGMPITIDIEEEIDYYKASYLNSIITDAGGSGFKTDNYYWTSSEYNNWSAWYINLMYCFLSNENKETTCYVRAALAF